MEIRDNYEHINPKIEYIIENILFEPASIQNEEEKKQLEELKTNYNLILQNTCTCPKNSSCDNALNDICKHSGNYLKISSSKNLLLNPNRKSKDLIYECSQMCGCQPKCNNRLVQFGPNENLEIVFSSKLLGKQHGLKSKTFLPKGSFVCEYIGEILTKSEAQQRTSRLNENKMNYIVCLNEHPLHNQEIGRPLQTFIDPEFKGNIGRYINHSCDPNCEILSVRIDSLIPKLCKNCIFAKRDILPDEELSFHYGGELPNSKTTSNENSIKCYCGSQNCQQFLPNLEF